MRPWPKTIAQAHALLDQVGLPARHEAPAAELSHGERRRLEVAGRAGPAPRLLLLDEPAAGMSPAETARLTAVLAALPDEVTVLLVEPPVTRPRLAAVHHPAHGDRFARALSLRNVPDVPAGAAGPTVSSASEP
ncbi:ATP-binding cassette domain-containing protein [Streptomyces vinaceus]|uniref:ATP-binding cassette domain-containing protein n=1 Tax=Streptomyces vinaceus TaxID=1960 RepID=UPI003802EC4A